MERDKCTHTHTHEREKRQGTVEEGIPRKGKKVPSSPENRGGLVQLFLGAGGSVYAVTAQAEMRGNILCSEKGYLSLTCTHTSHGRAGEKGDFSAFLTDDGWKGVTRAAGVCQSSSSALAFFWHEDEG